MNILALHNYSGAKKWRLEQVAHYINKYTDGKHAMHVSAPVIGPNEAKLVETANIIILQAIGDKRIQAMCEEVREKIGCKLMYELDDLYDDRTPKSNPSYKKTIMIKEHIESIIKVADAMTVTNKYLKDFYGKMNENVFVRPNYMQFEEYWDVPERHNESNKIRIGWVGGLSHKDDLEMFSKVIKRIAEKYPNVKFIYCGYGGNSDPEDPLVEVQYGEDIFKEIPRDRREMFSGVPVELWPLKLNSLDLDIGVAPLVSGGVRGEWNLCKTPIKWMEYAACRVPSVCSRIKYDEVVDHGRTGFLAETEEEWVEYLSKLIEDKKLRRDIGQNAYNEVKAKHDLKDHWKEWLEVYEGVLDGKYKYSGPRSGVTPDSPDLFDSDYGIDTVEDPKRANVIRKGLKYLSGQP